MIRAINVVDYGIGNLFSVRRAIEVAWGKNLTISGETKDIISSDLLILPGVGAFGNAIAELHKKDLIHPIKQHAEKGKPILGICLGMQLLATSSEEFGNNSGLNLIPGAVRQIPKLSNNHQPLRIPFIGWAKQEINNQIHSPEFLKNINNKEMYTIHSFEFKTTSSDHLLANYKYGGHKITSIVGNENITGVQFHPEKSGKFGLSFLNEYISTIQ
ncbi:MAG: imidazole glycerol phosphate synthase subunit HisH [Methylophilaceae bacterium]|nr:imidazole glycerol phosphate synthase subunit HisH [Methylophilaceae bacterium]